MRMETPNENKNKAAMKLTTKFSDVEKITHLG